MKHMLLAVLFTVISCAAQAQSLTVATGSSSGTYSRMLKEANSACATNIPINEKNTSGSMENMALLTGNQVNAAFTQTDVLYYLGRTQDLGSIKTLVALHGEEVHFVSLAHAGVKTGGVMGVGGSVTPYPSVEALAGRTVGAWGGSVITAQVIRLQSEIQYGVQEFPDAKAALAALNAGQIHAIVAVGGAPLGFVSGLDKSYRLIPISETMQGKLKNVYRVAKLNYTNLGQGGMGIPSVATDALFVTREYKTPKFTQALGAYRTCILNNLDELKETTGTHPKWQDVSKDNRGKWTWYELPQAEQPVKRK
jgi:TRAP-type uncharacterized transport system substrate-binding protein